MFDGRQGPYYVLMAQGDIPPAAYGPLVAAVSAAALRVGLTLRARTDPQLGDDLITVPTERIAAVALAVIEREYASLTHQGNGTVVDAAVLARLSSAISPDSTGGSYSPDVAPAAVVCLASLAVAHAAALCRSPVAWAAGGSLPLLPSATPLMTLQPKAVAGARGELTRDAALALQAVTRGWLGRARARLFAKRAAFVSVVAIGAEVVPVRQDERASVVEVAKAKTDPRVAPRERDIGRRRKLRARALLRVHMDEHRLPTYMQVTWCRLVRRAHRLATLHQLRAVWTRLSLGLRARGALGRVYVASEDAANAAVAARLAMSKLAHDPARAARAAVEAEVARVRALPAAEQATLGSELTRVDTLWEALDACGGRATVLLRASWLREQAGRSQRWAARGPPGAPGGLPPEATISRTELQAIHAAARGLHGQPQRAVPILAVSHNWHSAGHTRLATEAVEAGPDPDGATLERLAAALHERWHEFARRGVSDLGVFFDYSSIVQRSSPASRKSKATRKSSSEAGAGEGWEPEELREAAMASVHLWFAHAATTVWACAPKRVDARGQRAARRPIVHAWRRLALTLAAQAIATLEGATVEGRLQSHVAREALADAEQRHVSANAADHRRAATSERRTEASSARSSLHFWRRGRTNWEHALASLPGLKPGSAGHEGGRMAAPDWPMFLELWPTPPPSWPATSAATVPSSSLIATGPATPPSAVAPTAAVARAFGGGSVHDATSDATAAPTASATAALEYSRLAPTPAAPSSIVGAVGGALRHAARSTRRGVVVAPPKAATSGPPPPRPPPPPLAFYPGHELGALQWPVRADLQRDHCAPLYARVLFDTLGSLACLDFSNQGWGDAEAEQLGAVLPLCGVLTTLSLAANDVGDEGLRALSQPLAALPSLTSISLALNRVGDTGLTALADALAVRPAAAALSRVGAKVALTAAFGSAPLTSLSLAENCVGDAGLEALANAAGGGALEALRSLQLFKNEISDSGAIALARVLREDGHSLPALREIELAANRIGRAGAAALADALTIRINVPSLQYLGLEANSGLKAGDEATTALKRAVAARRRLKEARSWEE